MFFISPGQVFEVQAYGEQTTNRSGWLLLMHPEFLCGEFGWLDHQIPWQIDHQPILLFHGLHNYQSVIYTGQSNPK
ncbi:hypothetical protein [Dyadobacter sp. CY312]|uniref:hypothetical protein n=1 Tax=Dyadobacter sp. CY312 TaxID=2907303 RepID=UPI001F32E868|nr:hypothetical protein [Dyadobacter sp. CY312]MCE7042895.1 hypothetical protein [Dyadobacter sp. CY312]